MIREKSMGDIFINYRREDSSPYAGRLYDFLRQAFPQNKVFIDVNSIDPGEDFIKAIKKTLNESCVMITVIGPSWPKVTDKFGNLRLDDRDDYVALELSIALESSMRVIPVLVGGADMPSQESLPARLRSLVRRNPIVISDAHFTSDANKLAASISRLVCTADKPSHILFQQQPNQPLMVAYDLADKLATLKTLVWIDYALGVLAYILVASEFNDDKMDLVLIIGIPILGFAAWFNIMLLRGKNWARIAYCFIFTLSLAINLFSLTDKSEAENTLNVISLLLSLWVFRIIFTEPVKQIYISSREYRRLFSSE
jgi:hypothetical protein